MPSRRHFLSRNVALGVLALPPALAPGATAQPLTSAVRQTESVDLNGRWLFRTDPDVQGEQQSWFADGQDSALWREVQVPHAWQIEAPLAEYRSVAWYQRTFDTPARSANSAVRIEFEAVFHSAKVWVNGTLAGEHLRKGYTAFTLDVGPLLRRDRPNSLVVRVDNAFNQHMLPRGRSSDWAHDGGIYRPVQLLVAPEAFIERVDVDAVPDFQTGNAGLSATLFARNVGSRSWNGEVSFRVVDDSTGNIFLQQPAGRISIEPHSTASGHISALLPEARHWHFDRPDLYRFQVTIQNERAEGHVFETTFGVRKFEVRGTSFYLNNEPVRLMGVERMAGSNPAFGMAEPTGWILHDHDDLKNLNCVFTRVHWPQDKRVLDYCDRNGIFIQTEVPTWGPDTFKDMGEQPDADIMLNGLEQLREMVARDRNHPAICSWGLCNEIGGQNPPAYNFAKNMLAEAKRLDPNRLCSYASHSLQTTPGKDVAGLMDFIECNEYFGSWYPGDAAAMGRNVDEIHAAFPDKPIVISEYGYCACTAERPEGDARRREIMRTHDAALKERDYIAGLIFFCYNDYRTHVGDRGMGVLRQRVHGVVDLFGHAKPSYELLRAESSPIESLNIEGHPGNFEVTLKTSKTVPAYKLLAYKLRGVYYGYGDIPVEQQEIALPELIPGQEIKLKIAFAEDHPEYIRFDVLRATGFSAYSQIWKT
jgi:beta-glucuronidase